MSADELTDTLSRLWQLLRERDIDYVLVGGVALLQYVSGRNTEDIDLIMAASALERLPEIEITDLNQHFATGCFDGLQIGLRLTANPLFANVQREYATTREFAGERIRCATVEGLILLKLYALPSLYRSGDFARVGLYENDIATLIQAYHPVLEPLMRELSKHLNASDDAEVQAIVSDIQRRIARFEGRDSQSS